jgi:hypothetical protein
MIAEADDVAAMLPPSPTDAQVFAAGAQWMARAGHGRTALAALRQERAGPPRFGSLTDGLAAATAARPPVAVRAAAVPTPVDTRVHAPVAIAVIRNPSPIVERPAVRTTASRGPAAALVTKASTLESVTAKLDLAVPAVLHRVAGASAQIHTSTIVATDTAPATRVARGRVAAVAARGAAAESRAHLKSVLASTPTPILAGDVVVLGFPNASRDLDDSAARPRLHITGGPARVVALGHGGDVLADRDVATVASRTPDFTPPKGTERLVVAVAGDAFQESAGLSGWHAGTALAYVGWSSALAAGSVVRAEGASVRSSRHRRTAGWIRGSELVDGTTIVTTRFVVPVATVVVAIDDPANTDAGRNLSLGLQGATRATSKDGTAQPSRAVVRGNRTFLIYAVRQDGKSPVSVSVASESGWHLAGVMAASLDVAAVADLVATRGLDAIVRAVLPGTTGSRTLSWLEPDREPNDPPPHPPIRTPRTPRARSAKSPTAKPRTRTTRKRRK